MSGSNPSIPHAAVAQGPPGLVPPPNTGKFVSMSISCLLLATSFDIILISYHGMRFFVAAFLKHPRTPTSAPGMDYQTADSEHLMKRMRTGQSDEVLEYKRRLPESAVTSSVYALAFMLNFQTHFSQKI